MALSISEYGCQVCGSAMDVYKFSPSSDEYVYITDPETGRLSKDSVAKTDKCCDQPWTYYHFGRPKSINAQLGKEAPAVWYHEGTGEVRYPGRNDVPMPNHYKTKGYVRREFNSYYEHQKFCRDNDVINHRAEGVTDSRHKLGILNTDRG